MRSCGRVIFEYNNTPCNCVTSETISGLYINGGANFPSNAANNSLHFVKYDDNVVVYKKTNTGWIEVQNYSIGGSDTDTIIRFVEILPSGEWKWEVFDVVNNVVISNFNTPPVIAQIQSFEEQNVNYTGTQLPISPGINIGDTKRVKFSNFVYVNYTWDGTIWVKKYHEWNPYTESYWDDTMLCEPIGAINSGDVYVAQYGVIFIGIDPQYIPENGVIIVTNSCGKLHLHWDGTNLIFDGFQKIEEWYEQRICLNTAAVAFTPADLNNPLVSEVDAWAIANLTLQQRENGTKLVYFVTGDGGSCDVPDYEWTLNKGSQLVTLSNKEEKTNAITYVDNIKGSDIIGKKQYPNFPFKTFNSAAATLVDGDWVQYWNTDESISGMNILPTLTKYNFDFGKGDITINAWGNAFIGPGNFTDILRKDINIKNSGIFTSNKTLQWARNGEVNVDFNKWVISTSAFSSKDNVNIKVNDLTSAIYYPLGFFSPSNKNVNVDIKNVTVNSSQIGGYVGGLMSMEVASSIIEDTENNFFNVKLGNVKFNSSYGCVFFMYSYGGASIKNSLINLDINNFNQYSIYTGYPNTESSSRGLLKVFAGINPKLDNIKLSLNVKNQDSDISVLAERNSGVAIVDNCDILININRSVVRKLPSFQFMNSIVFNNTKEIIKGNYTNLSTRPIIDIINLELTNNSIVEFDGTFKANTNVSLTGLTIDATSKIVFKGRYELGNGFFDISGVTGAGADNVYFEDCTIVTNNTECIVSGTAKNVKILDVRSNKPTSANVTELVSSIIVNSVIN